MKKPLLLLCLCMAILFLPAQNSERHWLETALEHTESGTERVDLLVRLADLLHPTETNDALEYAEKAERLAKKINYQTGLGLALAQVGFAQLQLDRPRRAIRHLEDAVPYLQKLGDDTELLRVYEQLDWVFHQQGKVDEGRIYKQLALAIKQAQFASQAETRIFALEDSVDAKGDATRAARSLAEQSSRQREVAEAALQAREAALVEQEEALLKQEAELLQQELELAHLQEEAAKLEIDKMHLEVETMEHELRLQKVQRRNFWLGIGLLSLFALAVGVWQWYRTRQARKLAEFEKQQVEELRKVDQLKDQFLANTSHELRTPLNGMIGLAEAMYEGDEQFSSEV
ncbi:MAG: histidine kinase dimerization/phospho-acceptor domain-containing protein, partial [Bacteroidota bacterium]